MRQVITVSCRSALRVDSGATKPYLSYRVWCPSTWWQENHHRPTGCDAQMGTCIFEPLPEKRQQSYNKNCGKHLRKVVSTQTLCCSQWENMVSCIAISPNHLQGIAASGRAERRRGMTYLESYIRLRLYLPLLTTGRFCTSAVLPGDYYRKDVYWGDDGECASRVCSPRDTRTLRLAEKAKGSYQIICTCRAHTDSLLPWGNTWGRFRGLAWRKRSWF